MPVSKSQSEWEFECWQIGSDMCVEILIDSYALTFWEKETYNFGTSFKGFVTPLKNLTVNGTF